MKLIVGLGNPGKEYENTRHNAGFMFVEELSGRARFNLDSKFEALTCKERELLFVMPQTFMNDSGRSVKKIVDFYKMGLESIVIVHDDLDIKLGEYKIQVGVGPKVHNGVNSVEENLSSKNFLRIRIGIDNRENTGYGGLGSDYVLGRFSKEEREILDDILEEAAEELMQIIGNE